MKRMFNLRAWIRNKVGEVVNDDARRFHLQMVWVFRIVAIIAAVMMAINLLTEEYEAALLTGGLVVVSLLCSFMIDQHPKEKPGPVIAMIVALICLMGWFIISGKPAGFSPIWTCIVPPVALLLLGRWYGGTVCALLFAVMVFLMWTPWGRNLLLYEYQDVFLMRLPLVYVATFWVSWFLEYVREVTQKQLKETRESLRYLYRHDALTGVLNRYGFNEHIAEVAGQARPEGLALMIIDLDDFKRTNDTYGHPVGDAVLKALCATISGLIGADGTVSRWGGEEFAVLMNRREGAQDKAEAIRASVAAIRVPAGEQLVQVTVSIGLTIVGELQLDPERIVILTDLSLYQAKKNGKNQVVCAEYTNAEE